MSRINDYVIGEQEAGRMPVEDEPLGPELVLEDSVPIPDSLLERSDLNEKFGNLPKTIDKMEKGQSFALSGLSDKEYTALRARVSRSNKKYPDRRFALQTEERGDAGTRGRVFRIE